MNKALLISAAVAVAAAPDLHSQMVVAAPGVEARQDHKNIFDSLKYAWEKAQWAEGVASFRDPGDPLKRFRAVENAYSRFEVLLLQARSKRQTLKSQISRLNMQLKNAQDDAEVQKLAGSLQAAQTALIDLDDMVDTAHQQMESLQVLNENRKEQEEVAADESRERNRELARLAAEAEAELPDFNEPNSVPNVVQPVIRANLFGKSKRLNAASGSGSGNSPNPAKGTNRANAISNG
jgi:chromosome segregation ATPase